MWWARGHPCTRTHAQFGSDELVVGLIDVSGVCVREADGEATTALHEVRSLRRSCRWLSPGQLPYKVLQSTPASCHIRC